MPHYSRYVALGDGHTEGVGDGNDRTGLRGWADRLAELLTIENPTLSYANLAVRGALVDEVRSRQLPNALTLEPDLATVSVGINDLLRRNCDVNELSSHLSATFATLIGAGVRTVAMTVPDPGRRIPVARLISGRVAELNDRLYAAADYHGVTVVDTADSRAFSDRRLWTEDRLHLNPFGHRVLATAFAEVLGSHNHVDVTTSPLLRPLPNRSPIELAWNELQWLSNTLTPWMVRRLADRSPSDGRVAKHSSWQPVSLIWSGQDW